MRVIVMRAVRWISDAQGLPEEISDEVQWDEEFSSNQSMQRGTLNTPHLLLKLQLL